MYVYIPMYVYIWVLQKTIFDFKSMIQIDEKLACMKSQKNSSSPLDYFSISG